MIPARGLLVALLLAFAGVVLTQLPAHACKCATTSLRAEVKQVDVVFAGVVVESSRSRVGKKDRTETTYRIDAETVFKGRLPRPAVQVTSRDNSCGLDLRADRRYLFFVSERGADLTSDQCSGTARAKAPLLEKVEQVAGPGQDLQPPEPSEPAKPEFTPVEDGEPEDLTRLAAPGVALALVGLLGLLVVRRRDDRG